MALTNRVTTRVDLAHEPGQWVEVRLPSQTILDRAKNARLRSAMAMMEGLDLGLLKGFAGQQGESTTDYDWLTILASCVMAWSYAEPVTPENVAELDAVTVAAILAVLLPSESAAERKNA